MSEPAPVGHIFWDEHGIIGWRKDEGGWMTQVVRRANGQIDAMWSMGKDENGGLVIKGDSK